MRKKTRTILTLIAIIIGVASTVATISTVQTTQSTITDYTEEMYGNADYTILSQKNLFKEDWISKVKEIPGVSGAMGSLYGEMELKELKGSSISENKEVTTTNNRVKITAVSDLQNDILPLDIIDGSLDGNGLVIDKGTSSIWNVNMGDEVIVEGDKQLHKVKISAIVANTPMMMNPDSWTVAAGKPWMVIMPLHVFQDWKGNNDFLQQIQVDVDDSVDQGIMGERLNETLANTDDLFAQRIIADENQVATGFDALYNSLYMIGGLSLLISIFILYNTLHITIVERKREFAVMKAVGYTPGQVSSQILREVFLLSFIGAIVGVVIGISLSFGLIEMMFSIFQDSLVYHIQLSQAIIIGFLAGLIIPLIAVLRPVYSASRIPVTTIFREESMERVSKFSSLRLIVGLLLLFAGLIANHLFAYLPFILGLALLFPFLYKGVAWILYPIGKLIFGREGKLAFRTMKRHNNRTAMTTAILTFGIILLVYMSSLSIGVKDSMAELTRQTMGGDVLVNFEEDISNQDINQLQRLSGVNEVETFISDSIIWEIGEETRLLPISSITRESIEKFPLFNYDREKYDDLIQNLEKPNTIVLGSAAFTTWGGIIGEKVEFHTRGKATQMKVVGIVETIKQGGYIGFTHKDAMGTVFSKTKPNQAILLTDDASTIDVKKAILNNESFSVKSVLTLPNEIAAMDQQMEDIFFMVNALVGIGIIVAGIGILNTLLMNMMERMREVGVMRALGITRSQLRKMMMVEAFSIGAIAAFIGGVFGVLLMYITTLQDIDLLSSIPFVISWVGILVGIAFSFLVSMIACLIPSKVATKISVSNALKYD